MKQDDKALYGSPLDMPGEPLRQTPSRKPNRRVPSKRLLIVLGIVILLSAIGFGMWKLLAKKDIRQSAQQQPSNTGSSSRPPTSIANDLPATSEKKTFKSDHPRISFSYPADWTVTQATDGVRVESPEFSYPTVDSGQKTGNFRLYLRQGARAADSKYIGRGIAIEQSEKLTYVEPAVGQRTETNLTHFGLDTPDHFAYSFIAGNYSLQKGDTLGPAYGKEPETYIIAGGYSSKDLTDDLATNKVPLNSYKTLSAYTQALDILKSLKLL